MKQPENAVAGEKDAKPVYRQPFLLKLNMDKKQKHEQKFDKTPYVLENSIYIFPGESFGVNVSVQKDEISMISYQKDVTKADIEFSFKQEPEEKGDFMMMLAIVNKLKKTIYVDAFMSLPGKKDAEPVTILPIEPGQSGNEMWPQPIVQLILVNLRFSEKAAVIAKPKELPKKDPPKPVEQKADPKKTGRLKIENTLYEDRNGDGRIDYESKNDNPGGPDGLVTYKIDDDFDGFYDRQVTEGGIDGGHKEKKIHVEVSPIKGLKYPNQ